MAKADNRNHRFLAYKKKKKNYAVCQCFTLRAVYTHGIKSKCYYCTINIFFLLDFIMTCFYYTQYQIKMKCTKFQCKSANIFFQKLFQIDIF